MKTPEEIEEYLKDKYWTDYFVQNLMARGGRYLLYGKGGQWTIRAAFNWEQSPQGEKYWDQVNKEFTQWFNSK